MALLLSACTSTAATSPVIGVVVGFDRRDISLRNGPYPRASASFSCGSDTNEFAAELATVESPTDAEVMEEWGDVVRGRQWFVSGSVRDYQLSTGDLPFTHPWGKDVTLDIKPDKPYAGLAQQVGQGGSDPDGPPLGTLHWEIERGLVPHQGPGETDFLPGFVPSNGDRITSYGRWIIDCGHNDYHTELHPPTFVAFGHPQGSTTTVHAWYTPYYYTQKLNPVAALANQVTNDSRFQDPNTKPFPPYLVAELLRVGHVGPPGPLCCHDRIEAHGLVAANTASPISWWACAPADKPDGSSLRVRYAATVRPGVTLTARPDEDLGCVRFSLAVGPDYEPQIPDRKTCISPWEELNGQAQAALGDPTLDIRQLIASKVPPSFRKSVLKNPVVDCYDPLVVPAPGDSTKDRSVVVAADQPYPFYGSIEVSWAS